MTREVEHFALKEQAVCVCGCNAVGRPLANGHIARRCPADGSVCRSCQGRKNKRGGHDKQRIARRALGVPDAKNVSALTNEEWFRGTIRTEIKSGAQCRPVAIRFLLSEKQSEAARPIGDLRPFVACFMPDGWGHEGLLVVRLSNLPAAVESLYEQLFGDVA
jgi:hypothetical protein